MIRGQAFVCTYTALNTNGNHGQTFDAANHTLWWIKDGVAAAPTNTPEAVPDGPDGEYRIQITAEEATGLTEGKLVGISSTIFVVIAPRVYHFEDTPSTPASVRVEMDTNSEKLAAISAVTPVAIRQELDASSTKLSAIQEHTDLITPSTPIEVVALPVGAVTYPVGDDGLLFDDAGALLTAPVVTISSVVNADGAAVINHGAVVKNSGTALPISVSYDQATHGEAFITLSVSQAGKSVTGRNATIMVFAASDPSVLNSTYNRVSLLETDLSAEAIGAALLDLIDGVETGVTLRQAIRGIAAVCVGNYDAATHIFSAMGNPAVQRVLATLGVSGRSNALSLD